MIVLNVLFVETSGQNFIEYYRKIVTATAHQLKFLHHLTYLSLSLKFITQILFNYHTYHDELAINEIKNFCQGLGCMYLSDWFYAFPNLISLKVLNCIIINDTEDIKNPTTHKRYGASYLKQQLETIRIDNNNNNHSVYNLTSNSVSYWLPRQDLMHDRSALSSTATINCVHCISWDTRIYDVYYMIKKLIVYETILNQGRTLVVDAKSYSPRQASALSLKCKYINGLAFNMSLG
ncbi:unnamed protein product [Cunninghamella echinulata]